MKAFPKIPKYQNDLAGTLLNRCEMLVKLGRGEEGLQSLRQACAWREQLVQTYPDLLDFRSRLAGVYYNLGNNCAAGQAATPTGVVAGSPQLLCQGVPAGRTTRE